MSHLERSDLVKGNVYKIYKDSQTEEEIEGTARIIEIKGSELPFILDGSEVDFKVFNTLKCTVQWVKSEYHRVGDISLRRIRYLERIGYKKYENEEEEDEDYLYDSLL